jgi:acetylornithine deacetylase
MIGGIAAADPAFFATLRRIFTRDPLEVNDEEPIVRAIKAAARAELGRYVPSLGMAAWMDSSLLAAAGIPPVIFGPTGDGLHGINEWVDLESVHACTRVVGAVIEGFCQKA